MPEDAAGYERCAFHRGQAVRMRAVRTVTYGGVEYTVWKCTADPKHTKTIESE